MEKLQRSVLGGSIVVLIYALYTMNLDSFGAATTGALFSVFIGIVIEEDPNDH